MRISDWSSDVCSSDLLITIGNKIATGQIDAGIGGGSDTTSDVPIVYGQKLRRRLLEAARGKTTRDRLAAFKGFHFRELKPEFPGVAEIGRASCRERVWQYVLISGVGVAFNKKKTRRKNKQTKI